MDRVGEADNSRLVAHGDAMSSRAGLEERHAAQEVAVGDAAGAEHYGLTGSQILGAVNPIDGTTLLFEAPLLLCVARFEATVDLTTQALQGGGREAALGCATGAHDGGDVSPAHRRGERGDHVTIADQLDAGPGVSDLLDQLRVPLTVEDHDGQVVDVTVEGQRDAAKVGGHRPGQVDLPLRGRTDYQLLHVG